MKVSEEWTDNEFMDLLYEAENNATTGWEMTFVDDMKSRFERWGSDTTLSDRQHDTLVRLAGGE